MANVQTRYETVMIFSTKPGEEGIQALAEKFKSLIAANATIDKVEEWGKRRLAYAIDFQTEGYYVLLHMSANPDFPRELERNMQISEQIIRYLVVRIEED